MNGQKYKFVQLGEAARKIVENIREPEFEKIKGSNDNSAYFGAARKERN